MGLYSDSVTAVMEKLAILLRATKRLWLLRCEPAIGVRMLVLSVPQTPNSPPTLAGRNPIATNVRSLIQRFESAPPKGARSSSTAHKPANTSAAYGRLEPSVGYSAVQASRPAPVDDASSSTGSVLSYPVALIGSQTCDIIPTSMGEAPWCTQAKAPDRLGLGPLSSTADSN